MSKLHEPIAGFKPLAYPAGDITQFFGENPQLYASVGLKGHSGLDIVRAYGTPLYAVEDGKIIAAPKEDNGGNGKYIALLTDHCVWLYAHCSEILVEVNQQVKAGDTIAKMGNTGFVVSETPYWKYNPYTGTHLHLTKKPIKPYLAGTWNEIYPNGTKVNLLYPDNGYKGGVDFWDEFASITVKPPETLSASDQVAILAAKKMAVGETASAQTLFALATFLRTFGY